MQGRDDRRGSDREGVRALAARAALGLVVFVALLGAALSLGLLDGAQRTLRDARTGLVAREPVLPITLVAIDASSLERIDVWPWPRRIHASLIDALNEAGAGAIHFDVDFSSPSNPVDDDILADALRRSAAPVSLAAHVQMGPGGELIERVPLPLFGEHAATASVSVLPGPNGLTRRAERGRAFASGPAPSMVSLLADVPPRAGAFPIDFAIDPDLVPVIAVADVLTGAADPSVLRDRRIIVGATAIELGDVLSVPGHALLPGPLVQVLAAETLAQNRVPSVPEGAGWGGLLLMLGFALVLLWALTTDRIALRTLVVIVLTVQTTLVVLVLALEARGPVWLPDLVWHLAALGTIVSATALRLVVQHRATRAARRRIEWLADHDEPTRALQRHALLRMMNALPPDERNDTGLVAFELRRFAQVRETLGLEHADRVMRAMVAEIERSPGVRSLARSGDAEFVALIAGVSTSDDVQRIGEAVAARVRRVSSVATVHAGTIHWSTYSGSGEEETGARDARDVLSAARLAKDVAVERGERAVAFEPAFAEDATRRLRQEVDLPGAIARNELTLAYQPKIDLKTGKIAGVEALVRWMHPEMGFMRPDEFVAVAEASGAIEALGAWVLERACTDIAPITGPAGPLKVAVNVSPQQFVQTDVAALVRRAVKASGLPIGRLELEITESVAVRDGAIVSRTLQPLRDEGMTVALDDFGTGYAQLGSLGDLPVDTIKIDRSLIMHLPSTRATSLVAAALTIARGHDLPVVAEGVEDEATAALLRGAGCHTGQGYHWSRPLPLDELVTFLARNGAKPESTRANA